MIDRRGAWAVLAIAVLMMGFAFIDLSTRLPAPREAEAASARIEASPGVSTLQPASSSSSFPAFANRPEASDRLPPPVPFSFLGKVTEAGETTIVLYAAGRTFKVRGIGPLDEHYDVEAIHDDHLVLRYLPLNARQFVALASRGIVIGGAPGDSSQD